MIPTLKFSTLEIDGVEYRLAFTYSAIALAESEAGCNLLTGLESLNGVSSVQLRGLLYAALNPLNPVTVEEAGCLIRFDTAMQVKGALANAYRLSMERSGKPTRGVGRQKRLTNQELWDYSWSMARVHIGLSDAEFMCLTPRQFHLLADQYRERVEHQELISGIVAATIVNWGARTPKRSARPADFMPSRAGQKEKTATPRINRKRIADKVRKFFEA